MRKSETMTDYRLLISGNPCHAHIEFSNWRVLFFVWAIGLMVCVAGCGARDGLPVTHMQIGGKAFMLEIATTDAQRETGLMHRDPMADDHGMIFLFKDQAVRQFYNENVRFDIDVIFIDSGQRVVSIRQLEAYDAHIVSSDFPAQYVIELNRGTAAKLGVVPGSQLVLPKELPAVEK